MWQSDGSTARCFTAPHQPAHTRATCAACPQVLEGISRVLGPRVWDNCVLAFARASESSAPGGLDFHDHVAARADALRAAIRKAGGAPDAELPMALVENSSRCPTNADGEKVVPGEVPWVVDLVEKVRAAWVVGAAAGASVVNTESRVLCGWIGASDATPRPHTPQPPCPARWWRSLSTCRHLSTTPALPPRPPTPTAAASGSSRWCSRRRCGAGAGRRACMWLALPPCPCRRAAPCHCLPVLPGPVLSPPHPPTPPMAPWQVALKLLMDRVMDEDGCRGDDKGPFDARTQRERHEDLKREKVRRQAWRGRAKTGAGCAARCTPLCTRARCMHPAQLPRRPRPCPCARCRRSSGRRTSARSAAPLPPHPPTTARPGLTLRMRTTTELLLTGLLAAQLAPAARLHTDRPRQRRLPACHCGPTALRCGAASPAQPLVIHNNIALLLFCAPFVPSRSPLPALPSHASFLPPPWCIPPPAFS